MILISLSALLVCATSALPSSIGQGSSETPFINAIAAAIREHNEIADSQNIVVAPPNCPNGQVLVNGVCRDIWRGNSNVQPESEDTQNIVVVPPNCPDGQVLVNGVCRDIWKVSSKYSVVMDELKCPVGFVVVGGECIDWLRNVVTVPENCPEGQVWVNGACRDIWKTETVLPTIKLECPVGYVLIAGQCYGWLRNVVTAPNNCPDGQVWVNGACREEWTARLRKVAEAAIKSYPHNTVIVPENCRPNQQLINGQCRDIWRSENKN